MMTTTTIRPRDDAGQYVSKAARGRALDAMTRTAGDARPIAAMFADGAIGRDDFRAGELYAAAHRECIEALAGRRRRRALVAQREAVEHWRRIDAAARSASEAGRNALLGLVVRGEPQRPSAELLAALRAVSGFLALAKIQA